MDTYWENTNLSEEETKRLERRKQRREQMQKEKRLQLERRKKARRIIVLVSFLCVFFIAAAGVSAIFFKAFNRIKENKEMVSQWRKEEAVLTENNQNGESHSTLEEEGIVKEELSNETHQLSGIGVTENYGMIEFSDIKERQSIYSENVFSANAILVNAKDNTVVAGKGERERIYPASMTKVLTILVAAEHMTEEQLEDDFTMTREITDYSYINDCSYVGFLEGEMVKVKDMFYGTILQSGADAAVGLATYVAGSHEAFVEMMNQKLKELGIASTTNFTNCVGIHDKSHYSTAYDMAVIMKAALSNTFCKEVLSARTYVTNPTTEHPEGIEISNWFIRRIEDKETPGKVLGAKTGYVNESKSCAVSYGEFEDGTEYICVTTGAHSSWRCIYDHVEIYNKYIMM